MASINYNTVLRSFTFNKKPPKFLSKSRKQKFSKIKNLEHVFNKIRQGQLKYLKSQS